MGRPHLGITLLELLVVIAVIAIVGGIAVSNGHQIARRQESRGAVATFQQSVWQGATAAASRGSMVELNRTAQGLELLDTRGGRVLRRYDLPQGFTVDAPNPILRFTPPGKVDLGTLPEPEEGLVVSTGQEVYRLRISLIGEVIALKLDGGG